MTDSSPRRLELEARLDQLAAEYADVLADDGQANPVNVACVLVTAWTDPTDPDDEMYISTHRSASTPLLTEIGALSFAAARVVE